MKFFFYFVLGVISGVVLFPILMPIFVYTMVLICVFNGGMGICRL